MLFLQCLGNYRMLGDLRYFQIEYEVSEDREVLKKLPEGGALRCDRISCRGEPRGPDS